MFADDTHTLVAACVGVLIAAIIVGVLIALDVWHARRKGQ
jgi:flagellar biosynthesis protein FliQ